MRVGVTPGSQQSAAVPGEAGISRPQSLSNLARVVSDGKTCDGDRENLEDFLNDFGTSPVLPA